MELKLTGRVAVVTGASKGIGLAVTRALVGEGVRVAAGAPNPKRSPTWCCCWRAAGRAMSPAPTS